MINTDDDSAWEHINVALDGVIQAAQDVASKEQNRTALMFYNYSVIENGKQAAKLGFNTLQGLNKKREGQELGDWSGDIIDLIGINVEEPFNEDEPWKNDPRQVIQKYLQDCFGCSFRMAWDHQLNLWPIIGPFVDMIKTLKESVNAIRRNINPMGVLRSICQLANQFQVFCIQDLVMILMSLRMLFRRYIMQATRFRLDWTTLLGPLLFSISQLILSIIDSIFKLVLAPIDCVLSVLQSAEAVERATVGLAAEATVAAKTLGASLQPQNTIEPTSVTFGSRPGTTNPFKRSPNGFGIVEAPQTIVRPETRTKGDASRSRVITGIEVGRVPLWQQMQRPQWENFSIVGKARRAVEEARWSLYTVYDNLRITLDSLGRLLNGGVNVSLELGGALLFIMDLISAITLIIKMINLRKRRGEKIDWCKELAENPTLLEEQLRDALVGEIVLGTNETLASPETISYTVKVKDKIIGEIPLCTNARDPNMQQMLDQWFAELDNS